MSSRLERLVSIEKEIRKGRLPNVEKLCQLFEVKPRTVYEDIKELRKKLGFAIRFDRFRNGYYNANPDQHLPVFDLSDDEEFALQLSNALSSKYTGKAFEPVTDSAMEKIVNRSSKKITASNNNSVDKAIKLNKSTIIPIKRKLLLDLKLACKQHTQIQLTYYSASTGITKNRKVDPYRILEHEGIWYLIAYCHTPNDLRLFALHRIKEYKILKGKFIPAEDIDIDSWLNAAFKLEHGDSAQTITIHFQQNAARYICERNWHLNQKLTHNNDGSCILEFPATNLEEVKRWVLSFGAQAKVLTPNKLVNLVANELQQAVANYG